MNAALLPMIVSGDVPSLVDSRTGEVVALMDATAEHIAATRGSTTSMSTPQSIAAAYVGQWGKPLLVVDEQTGCWMWQAYTNPAGYGQVRKSDRLHLAHRWVYEQEVGPIPEGHDIDHLCRTPACCNPEHLEPVLPEVNHRRGSRRTLTVEQVQQIRARAAGMDGSVRSKAIAMADDYPVHIHTISEIIHGRIWRDPKPRKVVKRTQNQQEVTAVRWTSPHRGVSWDRRRRKWSAQAHLVGRKYHLGFFTVEQDAADAAAAFRAEHMPYSPPHR